MILLIIKNLWHRRLSNLWLFVELIIVTIVTWVIIDPVVVTVSDRLLPLGYNEDRLFYISFSQHPSVSPLYKESEDNDESRRNNIERIIKKLKSVDEIEAVAKVPFLLNQVMLIEHYNVEEATTDSLGKDVFGYYFNFNDGALSTIGAEAAEGCPSIEYLDSLQYGYNDIILPESLDRFYFPDRRGVNEKYLYQQLNEDYWRQYKVVGIIKDLRLDNTSRNTAIVYHNDQRPSFSSPQLIVRLKKGIDTDGYIKNKYEELRELTATGNYYVWDIFSVAESNSEREASQGITANRNLRISLALLFLISLILGVIGTVWLQMRRRISEIGIYRSFGALKINVRTMLIGENIVLSSSAILIGLLIYLQYAIKEGFYNSDKYPERFFHNYSWVADFKPHFALVSVIVAAIILLCVIIGTYLPARKFSDIEPVDALSDE